MRRMTPLLSLLLFGCTEPPAPSASDMSSMPPVNAAMDMSACDAQNMVCDLIYIPRVGFELSTPDGLYCGDATITYQADGQTVTTMCTCSETPMPDMGAPPQTAGPGLDGCVIDPPVGETTSVTVEAPGYAPLTVDVTLSCECHPKATVRETLVPM